MEHARNHEAEQRVWEAYLPLLLASARSASANKEVLFSEQAAKGFVLLTLTPDQARADLMAVSNITEPTFETRVVKTYRVTPHAAGVSAPGEG